MYFVLDALRGSAQTSRSDTRPFKKLGSISLSYDGAHKTECGTGNIDAGSEQTSVSKNCVCFKLHGKLANVPRSDMILNHRGWNVSNVVDEKNKLFKHVLVIFMTSS